MRFYSMKDMDDWKKFSLFLMLLFLKLLYKISDEKLAVENDAVLEENANANDAQILAVDNSDKDTALSDSGFTFGGFGGNSSSKFDFSNITFDFGNGTKFDLGSLMNGTISFNGTTFNISSLMNSNMTFGNYITFQTNHK